MEAFPVSIESEKLLMHRGRMKFIDKMTSYGEECGRMSFDVRDDNIFLRQNKELDPVIFIELIAQSVACHSGYSKLASESNPRYGYLVGVKDLIVTGKAVVGDHIDIVVEKDSEFESIVFVKGSVIRNGSQTICTGILKCWESETEILLNGLTADADPGIRYSIPSKMFGMMNPSETDTAILSRITSLSRDANTDSIAAEIYIDPDFIGFDGHFPGKSILPGIMMIKMGIDFLSLGLEKYFELEEVKQSKFMKVIEPGHLVRGTLSFSETGGGLCDFHFNVHSSNELCGKISACARITG